MLSASGGDPQQILSPFTCAFLPALAMLSLIFAASGLIAGDWITGAIQGNPRKSSVRGKFLRASPRNSPAYAALPAPIVGVLLIGRWQSGCGGWQPTTVGVLLSVVVIVLWVAGSVVFYVLHRRANERASVVENRSDSGTEPQSAMAVTARGSGKLLAIALPWLLYLPSLLVSSLALNV